MKGIILAGGSGSRLFPLTMVASKQLQPVYDKPMVYYPLTTLMEGGIDEICLISTPHDLPRFKQLFAKVSSWGVHMEFIEQARPAGIAQAFLLAEEFIGHESVALILGDNIFYGGDTIAESISSFGYDSATVFAYEVKDPERYGVIEFNSVGTVKSIEEKPKVPKSSYAIPGLYLFDKRVVGLAKNLQPSARGELEITDLIRNYLDKWRELKVKVLDRGFAWLDAGTSSSLFDASAYVQTIEKRQGIKIGCPEETALRNQFITIEDFKEIIDSMPKCEYRDYLEDVLKRKTR